MSDTPTPTPEQIQNTYLGEGIYTGNVPEHKGHRVRAKLCNQPGHIFVQFVQEGHPLNEGWWMFKVGEITLDATA